MVEPWDYRYAIGEANRRIAPSFPDTEIVAVDHRFYRDLGADVEKLGVVYDIDDRLDKSPLAYTDFLRRGRYVNGAWQPTVARVVGRYRSGGLSALNELVHENGRAVRYQRDPQPPGIHRLARHALHRGLRRRALVEHFSTALAAECLGHGTPRRDVTSHHARQRDAGRRLVAVRNPDAARPGLRPRTRSGPTLRASTFTSPRIPKCPGGPCACSSSATRDTWSITASAPCTAEIRKRTAQAIGPFDAGNPKWYNWSSEKFLIFGSQRSTKDLMQSLLGRPPSPQALLEQIRRLD